MPKSFSLTWIFEVFETHETFFKKPMFGGLAAYLHGRMVMILTESPGDRSYKDRTYNFDIWNGVLLPMERSSHESLQKEFSDLISHPVLGKWLYLPMSSHSFENNMEDIAKMIKKNDLRFGIYPKPRRKKILKKTSSKKKISKKNVTLKKKKVRK